MVQNSNDNKTSAFILTLFFPFFGLIYTLNHWRESWAKNTFWLACIYLGAVQIFCPAGTILGMGSDGGRYVLKLMEMYGSNITVSQILGQYQTDQYTMDLYQQLLTFLISRFSDNGHVLFAAFAIVFGYFYSRNIWYVLEKLPNKRLGYLFIIVTLYFLICPITQINGVRMWTATHVYVYGMMPYIWDKDKSKFWWVLITPLIHFSFLYVAIFAVVWFLLPYRVKTQSTLTLSIAMILFIVSLSINTLNLNAVSNMLAEYSPESYEERIEGYVNADVAADSVERRALNNWYVAASGNVKHWVFNLLLLFVIPCIRRNFSKDEKLRHLLVFALFLGSFANVMALIPGGGRFQVMSYMFKIPLILFVVMNIPQNDVFRKYVNFGMVLLLIPFFVDIRRLFDYYSVTAVIGNFITVFFWENNVPLITFIKMIF